MQLKKLGEEIEWEEKGGVRERRRGAQERLMQRENKKITALERNNGIRGERRQ